MPRRRPFLAPLIGVLAAATVACSPESTPKAGAPAGGGAATTASTAGGASTNQAAAPAGGASDSAKAAASDSKAVAAALNADAPPVPARDPKTTGFAAKGIFLTSTSMSLPRMYTIVKELKAAGGNTVVFDVKDEDGIVSYKSDVPLVKQIHSDKEGPIVDLAKRVQWLHDQGIHVVGRLCCFHDPILAKARPDLDIHKKSGPGPWLEPGWDGQRRLLWVDPSQPEVQNYIVDLAKELSKKGVDEIQFDYIRFPAMGSVSTLKDAKYANFDPETTPKWHQIQAFLAKAKSAITPMMVSIDVYGIVAWDQDIDWKITGQKLDKLAPYTDVICPMDYPSHFYGAFDGKAHPADEPYYFANRGVARLAKKVAGSGVTIRPWLQAFPFRVSHFTPGYVSAELQGAKDTKVASGWLLWNAQNNYTVGFAGARGY